MRSPAGTGAMVTGLLLLAAGAVVAFAVTFPDQVEHYVDTYELGLVLVWAGVLTIVMSVYMHRPRRPRRPRGRGRGRDGRQGRLQPPYADYPTDEHDVHRPGYAGQTRRFPTVRDRE